MARQASHWASWQADLREAWADHFEQQQLTAKVKRAAEQEAGQRMEEARAQAERAEQLRLADRKRLQVCRPMPGPGGFSGSLILCPGFAASH